MLLSLILWTLICLTIAIPMETTISCPLISNKLGEWFIYQMARDMMHQTFIYKQSSLASLLKRESISEAYSSGYTIPFQLNQGKVILLNISIGSPPQEIEMVVDTGSSFTWFPSHLNSSHFKSEKSTSWSINNRTSFVEYLDGNFCSIQEGEDIISLGNTTVRIPLGIGSKKGCEAFNYGILGMDKNSDFLKAIQDMSWSSLFSFSFKGDFAKEGENQFTIGGLGEFKEEDIIWIPAHEDSQDWRSALFRIDMPYIAYDGKRFEFHKGHKVGIDTGSTITVLPRHVIEQFWKVVKPKPSLLTFSKDQKLYLFQVYNLTGYMVDQYPAMTLRLGNQEWMINIIDISFGSESEGSEVYPASVFPDSTFDLNGDIGEISLLGATFWSHLKGLIFDYTPENERVGLVPRIRLINKSGLLNPTFISAGKKHVVRYIPLIFIFVLISFIFSSFLI